jgi:flavin reductase (DIM6/NTAB) family NADH-FMN oxidoreductase RutF
VDESAVQAFESVVDSLDYPMFIATTVAAGQRSGCLVGFATQCSIHPARFLVCVSDKNRTHRVLESGAEAMIVHVVPEDAGHLVELFGGQTGDERDKFQHCDWHDGPRGLPLLDDCPSWFAGAIVERVPLGDHVGRVLEPFDGRADHRGRAFAFSRAKGVEPGHEA